MNYTIFCLSPTRPIAYRKTHTPSFLTFVISHHLCLVITWEFTTFCLLLIRLYIGFSQILAAGVCSGALFTHLTLNILKPFIF